MKCVAMLMAAGVLLALATGCDEPTLNGTSANLASIVSSLSGGKIAAQSSPLRIQDRVHLQLQDGSCQDPLCSGDQDQTHLRLRDGSCGGGGPIGGGGNGNGGNGG